MSRKTDRHQDITVKMTKPDAGTISGGNSWDREPSLLHTSLGTQCVNINAHFLLLVYRDPQGRQKKEALKARVEQLNDRPPWHTDRAEAYKGGGWLYPEGSMGCLQSLRWAFCLREHETVRGLRKESPKGEEKRENSSRQAGVLSDSKHGHSTSSASQINLIHQRPAFRCNHMASLAVHEAVPGTAQWQKYHTWGLCCAGMTRPLSTQL